MALEFQEKLRINEMIRFRRRPGGPRLLVMPTHRRAAGLAALEEAIEETIADALGLEERYRERLARIHPSGVASGANLVHYLALRRGQVGNIRKLLSGLGLSSLERADGHVLSHLQAVCRGLAALQGRAWEPRTAPVTADDGQRILRRNAHELLGAGRERSGVRVMVTLPAEAADDGALVRRLVEGGMDCARINCAQGGPAEWVRMLANVHRARAATGRACRTFMDLTGPKVRTGPLAPGPRVMAIRTGKDVRGFPLGPAPVVLSSRPEGAASAPQPSDPAAERPSVVPVAQALLDQLRSGDRVTFWDIRGRPGSFEVVSVAPTEARALCPTTVYLEPGVPLALDLGGGVERPLASVGVLPALDVPIVLHVGDRLVLHEDPRPGEPARVDENGHPVAPAHISCAPPEVLRDVRVGEPLLLDDGKARCVIRSVVEGAVEVEVTHAPPKGMRLRANKGINLPESELRLTGLTDGDRDDLRFVAAHADGVNASFVNHPEDVEDLLGEIRDSGRQDLSVVLKIETRRGVQNLPDILLAALAWPRVGVMIARGDLAVEVGWTDLPRIQEEILRLCAAAHVPVIWATEVLDQLAKKGSPTRAEVSELAIAGRAACVMLNKGPHIVDAIHMLDAVLHSLEPQRASPAPSLSGAVQVAMGATRSSGLTTRHDPDTKG